MFYYFHSLNILPSSLDKCELLNKSDNVLFRCCCPRCCFQNWAFDDLPLSNFLRTISGNVFSKETLFFSFDVAKVESVAVCCVFNMKINNA